ncbi:MAG TPA: glycosyltransferase [Solirubrobacteraceae bacterium]|nr:glycosyltransferase [Solirubrobacteraceae bacterium]
MTRGVRALVITNMYPTPDRPALGSFVRDQVEALRALPELEVELFTFAPGSPQAYLGAAREVRRRYRGRRFDVVHAHFGLTAWPALLAPARFRAVTLHGTDLAHPRSRAITAAALPFVDLIATVSRSLASQLPRGGRTRHTVVLPCGVDTSRFRPLPRAEARAALGLDPAGRYLLFPADPRRAEKRHDRALAVAGEVPLLTLGDVDPAQVPLWVNAANAVLVPSEREGFGLAVLEALACEVPVLATPVGIAPLALDGIPGTVCAPFEPGAWRTAVGTHLAAPDPRVPGRGRAELFSAPRMAARVAAAWHALPYGRSPILGRRNGVRPKQHRQS